MCSHILRVKSLIFAAGEGVKSALRRSTCWGKYLFTENMFMHCKTPVAMWVTADVQPFVWVFGQRLTPRRGIHAFYKARK